MKSFSGSGQSLNTARYCCEHSPCVVCALRWKKILPMHFSSTFMGSFLLQYTYKSEIQNIDHSSAYSRIYYLNSILNLSEVTKLVNGLPSFEAEKTPAERFHSAQRKAIFELLCTLSLPVPWLPCLLISITVI